MAQLANASNNADKVYRSKTGKRQILQQNLPECPKSHRKFPKIIIYSQIIFRPLSIVGASAHSLRGTKTLKIKKTVKKRVTRKENDEIKKWILPFDEILVPVRK